MQPADRQRQQTGGDPQRLAAIELVPGEQRRRRQGNADHKGGENEARVPADRAGNDECAHAREMHEADAGTDNCAAGGDRRPAAPRRYPKADSRGHGGDQQRGDRQDRIVVGGMARIVGEHRHEVGGPDAGPCAHGGQEHPRQAPRALLTRGIRIGVEGRVRRCRANQRSQKHEPVVMLGRNAGENTQHNGPPLERRLHRIANVAQGDVKRHRR